MSSTPVGTLKKSRSKSADRTNGSLKSFELASSDDRSIRSIHTQQSPQSTAKPTKKKLVRTPTASPSTPQPISSSPSISAYSTPAPYPKTPAATASRFPMSAKSTVKSKQRPKSLDRRSETETDAASSDAAVTADEGDSFVNSPSISKISSSAATLTVKKVAKRKSKAGIAAAAASQVQVGIKEPEPMQFVEPDAEEVKAIKKKNRKKSKETREWKFAGEEETKSDAQSESNAQKKKKRKKAKKAEDASTAMEGEADVTSEMPEGVEATDEISAPKDSNDQKSSKKKKKDRAKKRRDSEGVMEVDKPDEPEVNVASEVVKQPKKGSAKVSLDELEAERENEAAGSQTEKAKKQKKRKSAKDDVIAKEVQQDNLSKGEKQAHSTAKKPEKMIEEVVEASEEVVEAGVTAEKKKKKKKKVAVIEEAQEDEPMQVEVEVFTVAVLPVSPPAADEQPQARAPIVNDDGSIQLPDLSTKFTREQLKTIFEASESATTKLAGGEISNCPAIFTKDTATFMVVIGLSIKMFSVATGKFVRAMDNAVGVGHTKKITCLQLNPLNPLQLYSASLDHTVRVWDITDGTLISAWKFARPVSQFSFDPSHPKRICLFLERLKDNQVVGSSKKAQRTGILAKVALEIGKLPMRETLLEIKDCSRMVLYNGFVVVAFETTFHVIHIESKSSRSYNTKSPITSLAMHPTEPAVAIGQSTGEIYIWYCIHNFGENYQAPLTTTWHWHADRVNSLGFTSDGVYMLSGGEEGVMVIWQLAGAKQKSFLPRLGAGIASLSISVDQSLYALGLNDGSVRVLSSVNLNTKQAVIGLKGGRQFEDIVRPQHGSVVTKSNKKQVSSQAAGAEDGNLSLLDGVVLEPRGGLAVVSGSSGCLQFYNVVEDLHVMEVEAVAQNVILRGATDGKKAPPAAVVVHVAFAKSGRWMATVDVRQVMVASHVGETFLRLWEFDQKTQTYIVNTSIDSPHKDVITSIRFIESASDPSAPAMLASTSIDGQLKLWQQRALKTAGGGASATSDKSSQPEYYWSPKSNGVYRDLPIRDSTVSSDGSVLAVACGSLVALWDPQTNLVRGALPMASADEPVLQVGIVVASPGQPAVVGGSRGTVVDCATPFLVGVTRKRVVVWNLVVGSVWWTAAIVAGDGYYGGFGQQSSEVERKKKGYFGMKPMVRMVVDDETGVFAVMAAELVERYLEEDGEELNGREKLKAEQKREIAALKPPTTWTRVVLFSPTCKTPIKSMVVKGIARGLCFMPSTSCPTPETAKLDPASRLLVFDEDYSMRVMGSWGGQQENSVEAAEEEEEEEIVPKGLLSGLFGTAAVSAEPTVPVPKDPSVSAMAPLATGQTHHSSKPFNLSFINDTPSHLLPPVTEWVSPFLEAMLGPRKTPKPKENTNNSGGYDGKGKTLGQVIAEFDLEKAVAETLSKEMESEQRVPDATEAEDLHSIYYESDFSGFRQVVKQMIDRERPILNPWTTTKITSQKK